jgi:hypothetical protein
MADLFEIAVPVLRSFCYPAFRQIYYDYQPYRQNGRSRINFPEFNDVFDAVHEYNSTASAPRKLQFLSAWLQL